MADNDDERDPLQGIDLGAYGLGTGGANSGMLDDDTSPTIGQRMAGMGPKPAPAPVDTPAPPMPQAPLDMSKLPPGLAPVQAAPSAIPTPPSGSSNPNLIDLAKQQAQYGKPLDPNAVDPATGKPKYKMGIGGKILGSLTNFASGFSKNPTTIDVGSGATNRQYARDEAMREGNLANTNTQIGTQEKLDNENEKIYRDAIKQAYEGQVGAARQGTAAAQQQTADVKQQLADLKTNQPPVDKIGQAGNERTALADKMGLKGTARTDYILTGKLPKEFTNPNQPTRGSKFDFDKIEKDKEKGMKDAEARANVAISKLGKPPGPLDPEFNSYVGNPRGWAEGKKQEIYAQLEKEKAQAQSDYEDRIREKGGTVGGSTPTQPAKPSSTKIDPNNLPKTVQVRQKDGSLKTRTVQGYNKQTGKPILAPE